MTTQCAREGSGTVRHAPIRGLAFFRVAAREGVPSDDEDVGEHLQAVAEHADFGARRMRPADRDLRGAQTVMPGKVEQFGIEAETLDALLFKNDFAGFALKGLEAALRINKRKAQCETHHRIEDDAGKFAE